ncbi:hypothetical protein MSAR_28960 [Mycolicibacterium sarraceniae]|uniref:Acyl-CoA dehydrogenase n=1 Tax=Mycolicibacterium sarraceniae TaxID=1534348 RepID=A0A7I7ST21_9MYCO|nr:hypothetical protein MSAR_28960 [Mycolicibacterium sarraceniae]
MALVEPVNRILPGTPEVAELLAQIKFGAKDRDLNDKSPFDQFNALKQTGFGTLRLPAALNGPNLVVRQLLSSVIDAVDSLVFNTRSLPFPVVSGRPGRSSTAPGPCSPTTSPPPPPPTATACSWSMTDGIGGVQIAMTLFDLTDPT